ncbi:hypothetical protein L1887_51170 [Cichorium endivia]|nr:hypothetical protein L1887_51170 [Cichorium endivia]
MRSWPNWPGRASGAVTLKKLECSKQAYALYTLAWDNIIGFRSITLAFGIGVMINRDSRGAFVCDALRCSGPHARYTDVFNEYIALADRPGKSLKFHRDGDRSLAIVGLQRGIPSKRESSARVDYVPALCTHRPSLLRLNGPVKC